MHKLVECLDLAGEAAATSESISSKSLQAGRFVQLKAISGAR
jgi:hypothetical protein